MRRTSIEKETEFKALLDTYGGLLAKVCYVYAGPAATFDDLYQEVVVNVWRGMDGYRGESKLSTWLYRISINTCITYVRRNNRHTDATPLDGLPFDIVDTSAGPDDLHSERLRIMYELISHLDPLEKAIVTLWLEDRTYDEIAAITGLTKGNVAIRLHRIKEKLAKQAKKV